MRNEKKEEKRREEKIKKKNIGYTPQLQLYYHQCHQKDPDKKNAIMSRNVINDDLCMSHLPIKEDE